MQLQHDDYVSVFPFKEFLSQKGMKESEEP